MESLFRNINLKRLFGFSFVFFGVISSIVLAAENKSTDFKIQINPGTFYVGFVDSGNNYQEVTDLEFGFDQKSVSMECLSGEGSPTMYFGHDASEGVDARNLYIANPDAAREGFTISIAATNGANAVWSQAGNSFVLDYNANDCSSVNKPLDIEGVTNYGGRMYIDPSVAELRTGKCAGCSTNGLQLGTANHFEYGNIDSITLVQASSSADNIADYILNGIKVSQTIPAMFSSGDYSLDMTISAIGEGTTIASGPAIIYDGVDFSGDDIYVDRSDSSNRVFLSSSDGSLLNWSFYDYVVDEESYNSGNAYVISGSIMGDQSSSVSVYSMGDYSYIEARDITIKATDPITGNYSLINIHFGTGYQCPSGNWFADESSCPTLTEEI